MFRVWGLMFGGLGLGVRSLVFKMTLFLPGVGFKPI